MQFPRPHLPAPLINFLDKFPLFVYDQSPCPYLAEPVTKPTLWIAPRTDTNSLFPWASSDAQSLRFQLLFGLAGVEIDVREWDQAYAAPEGTLPALCLPDGTLIAHSKVRAWLDTKHPLHSSDTKFHGYPSQVLEDQARAFGRLVEDKLSPALLASQPSTMNLRKLTPLLSTPPPLLTGLISPLPSISSLRRFDVDALKREGVTAVKALSARLREDQDGRGWILGCSSPTPLDCLVVANLFVALYTLAPSNPLRRAVEADQVLKEYIDRVMKRGEHSAQARAAEKVEGTS